MPAAKHIWLLYSLHGKVYHKAIQDGMVKREILMGKKVPVLVISGSMGSGKTAVLSEASDLLAGARIAHAAVDLDWLSVMYPPQGEHGERLMFANLAAVWPQYASAGAERLIIAQVVEDRSELEQYRKAVPGAEITVCRLTAPVEIMQQRLRVREPGMFQPQALARSAELDGILERAQLEDFTVNNGGSRSVTEVTREVLTRTGWL